MREQLIRETPAKVYLVLFSLSFLLNIFFFYQHFFSRHLSLRIGSTVSDLSWTRHAAEEAEAVAAISCSSHGRAYVDGVLDNGQPTCQCNTCYTGTDCSVLLSNCSADVESGDPLFLEPYWMQHAAKGAVVLSGWHRMSYATTDGFKSLELEENIRRLHTAVGNAITHGKHLVFGTGSTQLLNALVYALSPENSSSPASVVATIPYYSMYKGQTELFNGRDYEWEGATAKWRNSNKTNFIEFVTSPNNPDCLLYDSVLGGSSVIYDHAYFWPHFTAIPEPADGDVMIFTVSKLSGHAGSRFGWAFIKDENVYNKVSNYLYYNSIGSSQDTQSRLLNYVKVILAEIDSNSDIFEFGFNKLRKRWQRLQALVNSSSRFSLQQLSPQYCIYFKKIRDPSPAYAWLKCENEEDADCAEVLMKGGIISRCGTKFGASTQYTRLSLLMTDDHFEMLLQKLKPLVACSDENSSEISSF
ncbi:Tryptophan aminotransferase-related protein 4 [Rhynchospora pubera]|uniref:Tryptophan aminotransferase-related protein 4 n=1 Tax=Rhynchospora pubera TaxID=906938 RepID=A0AAV8DXI6_9POAL|nr:Tryptophan aminotransferase-related protein 4 [Rhynchospora pubera]